MFYHDGKLQYTVRVDEPNPLFAKMLQQAIGGVEGEIRVAMQYLFQAWSNDDPKYRNMLLETGTEELAHIEMLSTAVIMNLRGAPEPVQETVGQMNPMTAAMQAGMMPRHYLSFGLNPYPFNSDGAPFDMSHIYISGNISADMYANVAAESTGRTLACRLYEITDDPGMKDMLSFLIARDTMHQNQWLAVLEELGGPEEVHPIPNSFDRSLEQQEFSYSFISTSVDGAEQTEGRWTSGPSIDKHGTFNVKRAEPYGGDLDRDPQPAVVFQDAQIREQVGTRDQQQDKGVMDRITETFTSDQPEEHPGE